MIPEGKVISTIHGDPRALELTMEKLKKFGFTGYILTRMERDGYASEGYLVLKDGTLTAAVYGRRVDGKFIVTKKGEEGLKLAWGDTYDNKCDLEVHGRLDINLILQMFPMSGINAPLEKKIHKRRTRFSLEWGNNGKGPGQDVADDIPEELKIKLEDWHTRGYVVKFLQEEIKRDPKNVALAFEQFESNIRRAEFLKEELDVLDCRKFKTDVERLKAMVKNPSKITAIEAALQGLKLKIEQETLREKEEKIAELMEQTKIKSLTNPEEEGMPPAAPVEPTPESAITQVETAPEPAAVPEETEEKLAGQGDIIPAEKASGNVCTVCGADLQDKKECSTCGADNTIPGKEPTPVGDSNLIPGYTFDTFVVGESNRFSHSAAKAVSKPGTSSYNPLFIYSGTGLGKTHLLNAIGNCVVSNYPEKKVLYISTESFVNEFIDANKNNKKKQFRKKFRDLDFLLLDDINQVVTQASVQDELYHTLSALFKDGKQIVITCNRPLREVAGIKERLVSLFDSGLPTDMQPTDVNTRFTILKMKAMEKNIDAGDDVLHYIAQKYSMNIRMMEGALKTMLAYSDLMKVPMTLETANLALKDDPGDAREPEVEKAAEQVMPFEKAREGLKISHSYLIEEERPVKCFEYFVDSLNLGMRGMALTRVNPKRLLEQYDLGNASVLWLTDREGDPDTRVTPVLERIIYRIEDFLNTPGKSILLIDGLDYLISNNNFDSVLKFLRRLIDEVSESDAIFIMSITPETLDDQGLNILEREMEILSFL